MTAVTCSVCGRDVGRGPNGLGLANHANRHRREFREVFGRDPVSYEEVRDRLGPSKSAAYHDAQQTLFEAATDDAQQTLSEHTDGLEALTDAERDAYIAVREYDAGVRAFADQTDRSPGTVGNLLSRVEAKLEGSA